MSNPIEDSSDLDQPVVDQQRHRRWFSVLKWLLISLAITLLIGVITLSVLIWHFGKDLPKYQDLNDYAPPQLSRILDRNGVQVGRYFEVRRTIVPFKQISPVMIKALLSAEDADFYKHKGLDYWGMLRAIYNSIRAGRLKGSGSTITQQTVKNILLSQEKTLSRKIKEIILTRRIEAQFSKDDILSMYLNTIYFGHGRYGVEEASRYYFGVTANELTVVQAATLAGLIQSPERHSPRRHPESAQLRRRYVLNEMFDNGYLTEGERDEANQAPVLVVPLSSVAPETAQWWVNSVGERVSARYTDRGLKTGGLTIMSTLDLNLQRAAQEAIEVGLKALDHRQKLDRPKKHLSTEERARWLRHEERLLKGIPPKMNVRLDGLVTEVGGDGEVILSFGVGRARLHHVGLSRLQSPPQVGDLFSVYLSYDGPRHPEVMVAHLDLPQAALVALHPHTREVLAMVGGFRFSESAFNRATKARRQPGSAFKPFVYGAALESHRFTLTTQLLDAPETWPLGDGRRWTPKNYNGRFIGPVLLKDALAQSINSVAVRLADAVGLAEVIAFARRVGLGDVQLVENLTIALGSSELSLLELVNAYATFAADGGYAEPKMVQEVLVNPISALRGQQTQLDWPPLPTLVPALNEGTAWLIQKLLRGVVTSGSGRRLKGFKGEVIGKTGTSNEGKDAWFIGSLPTLTFGVWVGYDAPQSLGAKEAGGRTAAPIILEFLQRANWEAGEWSSQPETILSAQIDPSTGLLAREDQEDGVESYFLIGTVPAQSAASSEHTSEDNLNGNDFLFGGGQ